MALDRSRGSRIGRLGSINVFQNSAGKVTPVDAIYNAAMWEKYIELRREQARVEPSDSSLLATSPEEVKRQIERFREQQERIHIVV